MFYDREGDAIGNLEHDDEMRGSIYPIFSKLGESFTKTGNYYNHRSDSEMDIKSFKGKVSLEKAKRLWDECPTMQLGNGKNQAHFKRSDFAKFVEIINS